MSDSVIVNRTMAALRSKGVADAENTNEEIPKLVFQIPIGEQTAPGFAPSSLKAYANAETQVAYVYYGKEVIASFDMTDPTAAYNPFKWVTARRVIEMSLLDKIPTLAASSMGETMEYRALTNNLEVDANGFITAVGKGIGCVECATEFNGSRCVSLCLVKVTEQSEFEVANQRTNEPTDVFFINWPKDFKMRVGDYNPITAYVWPNHILYDDNLVKIVSDTPDVLVCDCGILHAIKEGTATLTASPVGYPDITANIEIAVEAARAEPVNVYVATELEATTNGVLHIDGTEALQTTKAINDIIQYAADNGYDGVKFPTGTYAIVSDDSEEYTTAPGLILISQSNLVIDFQGSTIAMQIDNMTYVLDGQEYYNNTRGRSGIRFDGAENVVVRNAIIKGTKNLEHDSSKTKSWYEICVDSVDSIDCRVENVEICESLSWGVRISASQYPSLAIWADEFQVGGYTDSGEYDETLTGLCTSIKNKYNSSATWNQWDDEDPQYNVGSDIWGNGDYPYCGSRMYNILWFDENQEFISICKNRHQHYTYFDKPANARYFAVHFTNPLTAAGELPTGSGGASGIHEDGTRSYVAALCCNRKSDGFTLADCSIHDNGTMGGANTGGWNCKLIRCDIRDNGGWDNNCEWDIEDGGSNTNIMFVDCNFGQYGLVTAMPCTDLTVLKCNFDGSTGTTFRAPHQHPRIVSNYFGSVNPTLQCQTSGAFCDNTFGTAVTRTGLTSGKMHTDAVYGYVGNNNYNLAISE